MRIFRLLIISSIILSNACTTTHTMENLPRDLELGTPPYNDLAESDSSSEDEHPSIRIYNDPTYNRMQAEDRDCKNFFCGMLAGASFGTIICTFFLYLLIKNYTPLCS